MIDFNKPGKGIQKASLPLASASELGNIYQYTGATENGLIHAHFYECVSDGQTPATYSWQALDVESDIEIETTISAQSVNTKAAGAKAVYDFVPKNAENIKSWSERSNEQVGDEWSNAVRTTAGSLSIDSSKPASLVSLKSNGEFKASAFKASGANLLNPAATIGEAFVIIVPKMLQGAYGSSDEANGIVFCDNNGNNLHPTVRFSSTYPQSAGDGTVVTPYQFAGHDEYFYPSSSVGYFIVSGLGVSAANACARIAWSRDYDKYEAYAAPSTIALSSIIASLVATHSAVSDKMLSVGDVADEIEFGATTATWKRRCSAVTPSWTTEAGEGDTYIHTATIANTNGTMKANGYAAILGQNIALSVEGRVVSFSDNNASCDYSVKYELETVATGTASLANTFLANDFGIEYLDGAEGAFAIAALYSQGIPDSVYGLIERVKVIEADLENIDVDNMGDARAKSIDVDEVPMVCGFPMWIVGTAAPSVTPDYIGQMYIDKNAGKVYVATNVTNAAGFKILN